MEVTMMMLEAVDVAVAAFFLVAVAVAVAWTAAVRVAAKADSSFFVVVPFEPTLAFAWKIALMREEQRVCYFCEECGLFAASFVVRPHPPGLTFVVLLRIMLRYYSFIK